MTRFVISLVMLSVIASATTADEFQSSKLSASSQDREQCQVGQRLNEGAYCHVDLDWITELNMHLGHFTYDELAEEYDFMAVYDANFSRSELLRYNPERDIHFSRLSTLAQLAETLLSGGEHIVANRFSVVNGRGCYGIICFASNVDLLGFSAEREGAAWTITAIPYRELPAEGRIAARRLSDGRIEFGFRPHGDTLVLPRSRFFPENVRTGRWLSSSALMFDEERSLGSIAARRLADGRVEFAFIPSESCHRYLPDKRYFPPTGGDDWLYSNTFEFSEAGEATDYLCE